MGPRLNRVRPFVKAAAGFVSVGETPAVFACLAIFPPPLACALAGGDTLTAYEIGGGIEIDATTSSFIRVDVADRILSYPGPTLDCGFRSLVTRASSATPFASRSAPDFDSEPVKVRLKPDTTVAAAKQKGRTPVGIRPPACWSEDLRPLGLVAPYGSASAV